MQISEFDVRQLNQMKNLVHAAKERHIDYSRFVNDQWVAIDLLSSVPYEWKVNYFNLVNEIEDTYSAFLDSGRPALSKAESQTISSALERMEKTLDQLRD